MGYITTVLTADERRRAGAKNGAQATATVAFGILNVQRPEVACAEMARVLKGGGRLAILEFGVPPIPGIKSLYLWYFKHVLPRVGQLISGHTAAYSYLPASVGAFQSPSEVVTMLRNVGFEAVEVVPLTFGIVYLYTATRRREGESKPEA
jgi:demethylmenaquinone methyltransferase/2-methoxy-6-polyprenyl-1,4-benzoquinol methylase